MRTTRREWLVLVGPSRGGRKAHQRQSPEGDAPDYVTDARDCRGRFYSDAAVEALLRSVEHAFDRFDHGEIELERWRPVVACLDVHTGGTDIVPSIRQTSTHKQRKFIESVYPNGALVERQASHLSPVEHGHPL